jgi:hypothetical protein
VLLAAPGCQTPSPRAGELVPTSFQVEAGPDGAEPETLVGGPARSRDVHDVFVPAAPIPKVLVPEPAVKESTQAMESERSQADGRDVLPLEPAPVSAEPVGHAAAVPAGASKLADDQVRPATCATCGHAAGIAGEHCVAGCDGEQCVPGRGPCTPPEACTLVGRFFANLYEMIYCPDPCYRPDWVPEANAGFFTDFARPKTMSRLRVDGGWDLQTPDRAEFFWARSDGQGAGPKFQGVRHHPIAPRPPGHQPPPPAGRPPGIGGPSPGNPGNPPGRPPGIGGPTGGGVSGNPPGRPPGLGNPGGQPPRPPHRPRPVKPHSWTAIDYSQISLYYEAAGEHGSFFIEEPYRAWTAETGGGAGGFGDLNVGTKSVLFDSELLLLTFQFKTYIPTGAANSGLGTGHTALEPSLLSALKLTEGAYLQGQLAQWIPIGGDPRYQGGVLHYHFSLNDALCRIAPDAPLIGLLEFNGWSFQGGKYTDPFFGTRGAGGSYFSLGPGLRLALGRRFDCGAAAAFALNDPHWANQLLRVEARVLY